MVSHSLTATDSLRAATLLRWMALTSLFLALLMPPGMSTTSAQSIAEGVPHTVAEATDRADDADDTRKWHISVISMHNCGACERLKHDFAHAESLTAFVDVNDHEESWSHYHVYHWEDATQKWRWKRIQLTAFPTILIQPPLSGEYGDPRTVVLQRTGYDGNDHQLARDIRTAITKYVSKLSKDKRVEPSLAVLPPQPRMSSRYAALRPERSELHGREARH